MKLKIKPAQTSKKQNVLIRAYSANSHKGTKKKKNLDRITVLINVKKPEDYPSKLV